MREEIVDEKIILSREFFDIFQGPVYKKRNFSQLLARDVRVYTVMIYHVIGLHTHTHTRARLTAFFPGLPGWAGTRKVQEAQLSPSDRAMRLVSSNLTNCHAPVQKLYIRQVLTKLVV